MTWSREDLESFRRSEAIDEAHGVSYRRSDEQWELLRSPVHPPVHPSCPLCDAQPARAAQPYTAVRSDVLAEIAPADYVEALCGVELPHHGMINCRLPGHEDGT